MTPTADIVRKRAANVLDAVRRDEVGVYRMIKQLVATTIKEYRGRFLHELIQNGYDAHPDGSSDGKIAVHFDEAEGEHGVLYVANGGRPLTESNFLRMASLGDSDKPIGVGIGNKGVGFKSVFQICDVPEVYSASDGRDPAFGGFSFRFGTPTDLDHYVASDDPLRSKIESELSLSLLTVPLESTPPAVAEFRAQGFVTVLRLPASSERAAHEIRERLDRLLGSRSPVMLFLDRLESLSIQTSSVTEPTVLTRRHLQDRDGTRVILNDAEDFLLFEAAIPRDDLLEALRDAVAEGALDERWLEWSGEARVSVAVGDGWAISDPAAFTFLPMGEAATSPLGGHINAPFVTDFARLGLDLEQPVNRLMMRRIAEVCVDAADQLMETGRNAGAVADLLAWDPQSRSWIAEAVAQLRDTTLDRFIRLPTLGLGSWRCLNELSAWPDVTCSVVTVERLVQATDALLIDATHLDAHRLERLSRTSSGRESLLPTPGMIAAWIEDVAASLKADAATLDQWRAFYDDLPALFSTGDALYGRRILLAESGDLVAADQPATALGGTGARPGRQRAVFFAPKASGTEDDDAVDSDVDISPPKSLARRIVFLHSDLDWYEGPQQTPGRKFLQDQRLARQFRTASLLTHLGQVMASKPSAEVMRDALRFAFRLFATNPTKHSKELAAVGLAVPTTKEDWILASRAHFSKGWDVPGAAELSDLVAGAPDPNSELAQISARLIAEPSVVGGSQPNQAKWAAFLKVLGVTATLPINQTSDSRRLYGQALTADTITGPSAPPEVPQGVAEQWAGGITSTGNTHHPWTYFTTKNPVYWFAGQHEIASLSSRLRQAYARLLILTIPSLTPEHRHSTWSRDRSGGWPTTVETPLWCFLTLSDWVPVATPNESAREFRCPAESWHVTVEDNMAAAYSPLIDSRLRSLMDAMPGDEQWKQLGFLDWRDPKSSAALIVHLAELHSGGEVPESASEHLRSSLAYAWNSIGDPTSSRIPTLGDSLLVEAAGQLSLAAKAESRDRRLFVTGAHDQSAAARLVRELGWPAVVVDTDEAERLGEVAGVLRDFWQGDVQITSEWNLEVLVDGTPWQATDAAPRLVDEIPWFPLLIAACTRYPRSSGMRVGGRLGRALDQLNRVRIVRAGRVAIASSGGDQALPARLRGVLPMAGEVPTLLAENCGSPPTWDQFEVIAQAVLELLEQERFKAEVSLTVRDLSTAGGQTTSRPSNAELADILQVSEGQINEVESAVFGAVTGMLSRLRPVAGAIWGNAGVEAFIESRIATYSREDIVHTLTDLCGDEREARDIADAATDTLDANDLRRRLGVSIVDFNACLALHFPAAPLVDNSRAQAEEFDLRRRQRQRGLLDWARGGRIARFDAGEIQPDWVELRDLSFLRPDPAWATTMDELSLDRLDESIDAAMLAEFGTPDTDHLPDYEAVRAANGRALRERLSGAHAVVTAWCEREGLARPVAWASEAFDSELRHQLDRVGALDFRELSDAALAQWLARIDAWPTGMALSVAPESHGLSHASLHAQEEAAAEARAQRIRAARRLTFQGAEIDLDKSMSALVDRVSTFLEAQPSSLDTAYRTSRLSTVSDDKRSGGTRGDGGAAVGGTSGGVAAPRLSNEQTGAIGLVGEMVAFHWLKLRDPSGVVDESCWKSGNCRLVIEGASGDDGLGYDFEVPRRGGSVMYEVKATSGDASMIELGETEVRCAQQFARTDRWRLLVVEDVLSDAPRVHMLPNPFRHSSRPLFRFVGNSVRLRFKLS